MGKSNILKKSFGIMTAIAICMGFSSTAMAQEDYTYRLANSPESVMMKIRSSDETAPEADMSTPAEADPESDAASTSTPNMAPAYDIAVANGLPIDFSCMAPVGASVIATLGNKNVELTTASQAEAGILAMFTGQLNAPSVDGTNNLGYVTYTITYDGKTTGYQSAGRVTISEKGAPLIVQVKNNAANIYQDQSHAYFIETARLGAVDYVKTIGRSDYELYSGGWIPKRSVVILSGNVAVKNKVSSVSGPKFDNESSGGEYYTIKGTSNPMFRAFKDGEKLYVKLMNTTGLEGNEDMVEGSKLFSKVKIEESNGDTTLQFMLNKKKNLWGYDISYNNGVTTIYAKYKPKLSEGKKPLNGVTVVLDPGHGGRDTGAIGLGGGGNPVEKDINLAVGLTLEKRLQALGATVVMTRSDNSNPSLNERMTSSQRIHADLFMSLHCNSGSSSANGIEVYYYEPISQKLANSVMTNLLKATGRNSRGVKQGSYRVTLNTYAPSVLIEMGYMTNVNEYNSLISMDSIGATADAIAESVVDALK